MNPFDTLEAALNLRNVKAADRPGLRTLLEETLPQVARLTTEYAEACKQCDILAEVKRVRTAELVEAKKRQNERFLAAIQESVDNPAYDVASGAQSQAPYTLEVELRQEGLNLVEYVLAPAAEDTRMDTQRDLQRFQHVEAAIYAADSHAALLEQLERAGVYQTHGRIVAVSENSQRLQAIAEEAGRQAAQAESDLKSYRDQQIIKTSQRQAGSAITRAEAIYSAVQLSRNEVTQ
jgi:uncharacterized protein YciI